MSKATTMNWKKYALEFLSIFIAVIAAFSLNNWNDNRRDRFSEEKILREIQNGLQLDLKDIDGNKMGHQLGIRSCQYFRELLDDKVVDQDSLALAYTILVRDFTSIMNLSGYESLKSKGLEVLKNDSIRFQVISLYDYYYQIIYKLEESAVEMQSFQNYFHPINDLLSGYLLFDKAGKLIGIESLNKMPLKEKKRLLSYLWRIENNRAYKLRHYAGIEQQIKRLQEAIELELTR